MWFTDTEFIAGLLCKFSWKYVPQFRRFVLLTNGNDEKKKKEMSRYFLMNQIFNETYKIKIINCWLPCFPSLFKGFNYDQIF